MGKEESVGSDKAELKKMLKIALQQPVNMAFALGGDGKAIIQMHKIKQPRALEKGLKEADGTKNHRFGTVIIDPDSPKVAKFVVNKPVGGFARKLVIALKGTGFKKIQIVTEDGGAVEEAENEEDEEEEEEGGRPGPRLRADDDDDEAATSRHAERDDAPAAAASPDDDLPANGAAPDMPASDTPACPRPAHPMPRV